MSAQCWKCSFLALGAQLVVAVEHQDVLDDQAVGLAVELVRAHLVGPGGGPVHHGQVLIGAVHQLGPAHLVQAEDDVGVLVLVGGLHGGGVAGDDGVVVQGDGEAGLLGGVDQPGHALGGVGVGVDADGVAGIILGGGGDRHQGQRQGQHQQNGQQLFHGKTSFVVLSFMEDYSTIKGVKKSRFTFHLTNIAARPCPRRHGHSLR